MGNESEERVRGSGGGVRGGVLQIYVDDDVPFHTTACVRGGWGGEVVVSGG